MAIEVPGYGNSNAKLMFVGEAPAANEIREGKPFVGRAGAEFDEMLSDVGIKREKVYVTNICLERIPSGNKDDFLLPGGSPSPAYIRGIQQVVADVKRIKPNVVVPLGKYALWGLTMLDSIMKWRGSILWSPIANVKLVPTIHPAALLRGHVDPDDDEVQGGMWRMRPVILWDLERANNESTFRDLRLTERRILVDPDGADLEEARDRLANAQSLTFDIETFGGLKLACIGFSDGDPNWAVVFTNDGSNNRRRLYKDLLESDCPKIGQNLMYDCGALDQLGIFAKNIEWDAMIAAHRLNPQLPKRLAFLTSIYTDIPFYKDEGKGEKRTVEELAAWYQYNGKDICSTTECAIKQRQELDERGLMPAMNRAMGVFEPLRGATFHGWGVDHNLLRQFINKTTAEWREAQAKLDQLAGRPVNVNSHVQVKQLIYGDLKLPARTRKGKVTSNAKVLLDLATRSSSPALRLVIRCREARKLISSYYSFRLLSPDGRLRTSYNIPGTVSARLSASAPLWGPGINGQTLPPAARRMVVADDGCVFLECDQSQAETIITAYLADDPVHIDCFRTGKDVHRVTACLLLGKDPSEWKSIPKGAPIRQLSKKGNHELNYGATWVAFMYTVNEEHDPDDPTSPKIDPGTSKSFVAKYHAIRPAVKSYWERVRQELRHNQMTLTNLFGWQCQFLDRWSDALLRLAYSWKPQSTVAEATNVGIVQVLADESVRRVGVRLAAQTHDSATWHVPAEAVTEIGPRIMKLMEVPLLIGPYPVTIPIEGMYGRSMFKDEMTSLGLSRTTTEDGYVDSTAA